MAKNNFSTRERSAIASLRSSGVSASTIASAFGTTSGSVYSTAKSYSSTPATKMSGAKQNLAQAQKTSLRPATPLSPVQGTKLRQAKARPASSTATTL